MSERLSKNFTVDELKCPCCGECKMDAGFITILQSIRTDLGVRFSAVKGGGYRCASYNGSTTGAHVEGKAIDPDLPREYYFRFMELGIKHGLTGIGVKNKGGKFQIHGDSADQIDGKRPRPWIWTY
ncbi:unnamed protein product [marine sediment metagenome]|uniref:Peptidase M15A C-terminal domain-containing protein n=1 Tax=marine sediment metagenome TaxID=412755 RepID=X1BDS6_9ZZZZ